MKKKITFLIFTVLALLCVVYSGMVLATGSGTSFFLCGLGWRYFSSCLGILSGNLSGRKFPGWLRESVLLSLQWDLQHFSS